MKHLLLGIYILSSLCSCQAQQRTTGLNKQKQPSTTNAPVANTGPTRFGVLIKPPAAIKGNGMNFKLSVARKLGLNCLRDAINLDNPKDKPIYNSGFNVVLNVNYSSLANKSQSPFATDTTQYKSRLQYQLSLMMNKPVLLVIENEENNQHFHSGTAQDYLNQLQAAATVAHANGIPVTNGGITYPAMLYLVYLDYLERGKKAEAND